MVTLKGLEEHFFIYTMRRESEIIINFTDMLDERYIFAVFTTEVRTVSCLNFDCSDSCVSSFWTIKN